MPDNGIEFIGGPLDGMRDGTPGRYPDGAAIQPALREKPIYVYSASRNAWEFQGFYDVIRREAEHAHKPWEKPVRDEFGHGVDFYGE